MTGYVKRPDPVTIETPDRAFTSAENWAVCGSQWDSSEVKSLSCCAVRDETHDVKTFVFRCDDFSALSFEPGQFITVSPNIAGQSLSRCYTLSSSPTRPYTFSITVKRVPGGVVSNWLHDNLHTGETLRASGPAGGFTPVGHPAKKLLYLSAGSGVTPLMSMTRASVDMAAGLDIVFIHSARTPGDIIFHDELSHLQASLPSLRIINICESKGTDTGWDGPVGRLDLARLQERVPDFKEREIFTCGPQGYMSAVKALLTEGGSDFTHYHQESFDFVALEEPALIEHAPTAEGSVGSFQITLARSGRTFDMLPGQTVLSAAKKAGAIIPSSCSQGVCGTCKTLVLQGTVEMNHSGGIRQREIDKGLRLLCCSRPTSDLVIDL